MQTQKWPLGGYFVNVSPQAKLTDEHWEHF